MPKTSQNILIFIDSAKRRNISHQTPAKIAMSYMNRFTIDEDASFELIGVHFVPLEPIWGGDSGQSPFSEKITQISRTISIRNIRESENHFMFALNVDSWISTSAMGKRMHDLFNILLFKFHQWTIDGLNFDDGTIRRMELYGGLLIFRR